MYSLINTFNILTQKEATSDKSLYLTIHWVSAMEIQTSLHICTVSSIPSIFSHRKKQRQTKAYILQSTGLLQWRFRQACTNVQSHQYLHWSHTESSNVRRKLISYNPLGCCNGDSDRPAQMYSLINTFTGHTQKVATSDKTLHL